MISKRSLIRVVKVLAENLIHCEHVDFVLLEHCPHGLVAPDLAFVVRVLQVFLPDIGPYPLDSLWSRQLFQSVRR